MIINFRRILYFFLIISLQQSFGWGDQGHKLIAKKALEVLPAEMQQFAPWFQQLTEKSVDPDYRKGADKSEGPKHYIDIDYYKEFKAGKMPFKKKELEAVYTQEVVKKQGLLPWAALDTYNNLVNSMRARKIDDTKLYMSDLAHYIADATQPMHTIVNYDGQLTGQKGVHARYEIHMVAKYYDELAGSVRIQPLPEIADLKEFVFGVIHDTHTMFPLLLYADSVARQESPGNFGDEYYAMMWHYTKKVTVHQIEQGIAALAALYYRAWVEAGKPQLKNFN